MAELAGGKAVVVDTAIEHNFLMTAQQLREAISPKSRVLILCTPSNPSGVVYPLERLQVGFLSRLTGSGKPVFCLLISSRLESALEPFDHNQSFCDCKAAQLYVLKIFLQCCLSSGGSHRKAHCCADLSFCLGLSDASQE